MGKNRYLKKMSEKSVEAIKKQLFDNDFSIIH